MDPAHVKIPGSGEADARRSDEIVVEIEGGTTGAALELDDLQQRAVRMEREARDLAEAARSLLDRDPSPGDFLEPGTAARNPLRECELAAACRAAGLYERAVQHTVRAAEILVAAGCLREAREILEEGSTNLEYQAPEALESLSRAWARIGVAGRAAEIALSAAERHRATGRAGSSVDLCRRTAELAPETPGLHRTWGLALLALGDAASALGHLALWRTQAGEDASAMVWFTQALFELDEDVTGALRELARRVGLRRRKSLPIEGLGARVAAHLRRSAAGGPATQGQPFWEQPELCGKLDVDEDEGALPEAPDPALEAPRRRPRVFISLDTDFHRVRLSEILGAEGIDVLRCSAVESLEDRLARESLPVDLLLTSLSGDRRSDVKTLERIRKVAGAADVPVLCVTQIDRSGLDFDELRQLGVVGLIDRNALPEEIVFRVNAVVWGRNGPIRRYPRAPVFLAVDLDAGGQVTSEYASTLACGGMGLVSRRALATNDEVRVRFRLPSLPEEVVEAHGKVVHCRPFERKGETAYRIGLFFYPLSQEHHELVDGEVLRILEEARF